MVELEVQMLDDEALHLQQVPVEIGRHVLELEPRCFDHILLLAG
jgi:hypothetical protein